MLPAEVQAELKQCEEVFQVDMRRVVNGLKASMEVGLKPKGQQNATEQPLAMLYMPVFACSASV